MTKTKLLEKAWPLLEAVRERMTMIFIINKVRYLDLKSLPQEALCEWEKLHRQTHRVNGFITYVTNEYQKPNCKSIKNHFKCWGNEKIR